MFIIRKKFRVEYSHRLMSSYSECCQHIHGHSAIIELFFKSEKLNNDGMVMDFGQIKNIVNDYINTRFDHTLILHKDDPLIQIIGKGTKNNIYIIDENPTAENFAKIIYNRIKDYNLPIYKVRFHETETGYAEYYEEK